MTNKTKANCGKCGKAIAEDQTVYQVNTGGFEGEVFQADRYDLPQYFHDKCLDIL